MNLVVTSHGLLCTGILDALQMMVHKTCPIAAISLDDQGIDDFRDRLRSHVLATLNSNSDGIFIMSDLIGGTPYNESAALLLEHPDRIRVVTGLNFPMILEVALASLNPEITLDSLVSIALEAGSSGVSECTVPTAGFDSDEELF